MKKLFWTLLIAGTFMMVYVMKSTGSTLETNATPLGIINLETASSKNRVDHILDAWKKNAASAPDNITAARKNTYLDFLFILFYVPFLYFSCKKITATFGNGSLITKTGSLVATGILIAGILDALENFGMLQSLDGFASDNMALFTASCSIIKWTLVFITIFYLLAALTSRIFIKKRSS